MSDFIKTTMGSQFVIPVYQRNYTWNPEVETARFLNDLEDLLAQRTQSHFLGILIYMESEISAMFKQIQIVDGQQRLTTSFIFLLCLKRAALELGQKDVAGMIDDYYLYNRHTVEEAKLRMKPTVSDDDVYAKIFYGSYKDLTRREKETTVYRNYDAIYTRIMNFAKKYSLAEILNCLGKFDILVFPLSENDNAQQIFESINSTGAPLTSADLIRNYVLMNDTNDVQERNYRLYWQPLEISMPEPRRLEEFFRIYLAAKTYNLLSKRDVYEGFKDYWNSSSDDRETRLRDINRYCRYVHAIYTGPADSDAVEAALRDFRRSESRLPAPFLAEMFRMYEDREISEKTLIDQIRLIDTYLTRRALCGNDTGSLSRYFPQLLRSVMNSYKKSGQNVHEITKVFLINYNRGKPLAMPTDEQLRSQLREINAYALMCIRPVLERIEHHGATAEVDTANLNIEHIMPQHPNAYWKKAANAKDEDEYTFYANLIGNLTLCAEYDNTKMGNQDFNFKKKVLSKTLHIRMNTEILKKDQWTPKDILDRCDRLTREIIEIYPYRGGKVKAETAKDDNIIILTAPTVNARAIYHNPQSIEVLSGSTMKAYGPQEMKSMRQLYQNMTDLGVLSEDENGRIQFEKNYRFHNLNTAAQFLLHRGGDNTAAWTRENGTTFINENEKETKPEEKQNTKQSSGHTNRRKQSSAKKANTPAIETKKSTPAKQPAKQNAEKGNSAPKKRSANPQHRRQQTKPQEKPEASAKVETRRISRSEPEKKEPVPVPVRKEESSLLDKLFGGFRKKDH